MQCVIIGIISARPGFMRMRVSREMSFGPNTKPASRISESREMFTRATELSEIRRRDVRLTAGYGDVTTRDVMDDEGDRAARELLLCEYGGRKQRSARSQGAAARDPFHVSPLPFARIVVRGIEYSPVSQSTLRQHDAGRQLCAF
jgi:hypothetical protein